jgi:hypothetical protein
MSSRREKILNFDEESIAVARCLLFESSLFRHRTLGMCLAAGVFRTRSCCTSIPGVISKLRVDIKAEDDLPCLRM